jgi:protein-S-isoprenylcysteine O-methyltransferase Ste14
MPTRGLFGIVRHPIYVAFALTLWTVPVWTPDQLALALALTAYCLLAPMLKERRLAARHGEEFARYRARVPYAVPRLRSGADEVQGRT